MEGGEGFHHVGRAHQWQARECVQAVRMVMYDWHLWTRGRGQNCRHSRQTDSSDVPGSRTVPQEEPVHKGTLPRMLQAATASLIGLAFQWCVCQVSWGFRVPRVLGRSPMFDKCGEM